MSHTKFVIRETQKANAAFNEAMRTGLYDEAERNSYVETWVEEALLAAEQEVAEYREMFGGPEDTPCIQSADTWGTGEGQFHGVI